MSTTPTMLRQPTFGRPTQQTGQNNRKPFNRPSKPTQQTGQNNRKPFNRPSKPTLATKPLSDGLTNQTGHGIGRRVIQNTVGRAAGKAVGKIVSGVSVVGKIQNAWDLGTGIGGLGRGLLGIDEINPYGDMPGFGAAELAWDLGDAINNLITNPNSEKNTLPDVRPGESSNSESSSSHPKITANPFNIDKNSWDSIDGGESSDFTVTTSKIYPKSIPGIHEFIETVTQFSSRPYTNSGSNTHHLQQYSYLDEQWDIFKDLEPESSRYTSSSTRYKITNFEGIRVDIISTFSFSSELTQYAKYSRITLSTQISYSLLGTNIQYYDEINDAWVNLQKPGETILFRWPWFINSNIITTANEIVYANKPWASTYINTSNEGFLVTGNHELKLADKNEPINLLTNGRILDKMVDCKALDAFKAMEKRVAELEERLNKKLGEEAIEKIEITKTTINEDGEETKTTEEIELDGISGTVAKILQNQYEGGNEEILKRLGDPITPETQLPSGETLAAAGIGIGGLAGVALLTQKKLGKAITKLPTFNNAGTPTNIIPEIIEADTGGIGGGIDKINKEMQEDKHEKAKKHKLELKANLIALLDLALSIHNAFALSSSLIDTIFSFVGNVFQMFGFKDENGQPIDVKEVAGDTLEDVLKVLIGADATEDLLKFLVKSNRIIQSASNVLFDLQGLTDSVRSISQQTGEYVAKIGNALKRNRIVPDDKEDSYDWMDERMSPTSAFQKRIESISEELNNVTDFMGSLESVTSEVISAQEQFVSLKNNATEFKNLVAASEAEKGEKEIVSTTNSQSPEINLDSIRQEKETTEGATNDSQQ